MVDAGAGDAADDFAGWGDTAEEFGKGFANETPPVCVHADFEGRVGEDSGCPFDGVDLGHEGAVDEAGFVEDLIAGPIWVGCADGVADGVMLHSEESMQHFHSDPPIVVEPGERISIGIAREELRAAVAGQEKLAVVVHVSQRFGRSLTGTVYLGAIPPCCIGVLVPWTVEISLV